MTWAAMARDLAQHLALVLADDYRIERELGGGGTARVFLAHDLRHDRLVALKVLRPELALAVGAERFLREIHTAAKLSHPGIVPLFDSGEADGLLYFTMPFLDGGSLRHRLEREKRLPVDEAIRIACAVAGALDHAHERGVIHRDVKPENILFDGDRPMVADFGIALVVNETDVDRLTHTGVVVGTPQYMSPEQSAGLARLDRRTDVYGLACVLHEMLAGAPPFVGVTPQEIVARQRAAEPPSVRALRKDVPAHVAWTVATGLSKLPTDRFATVEEFGAALLDRKRSRRLTRRQVRRLRAWTAAALGALVVAGGAAKAVRGTRRAPLRERDWVVVADFDGPPTDPGLGRVVRELVTAELNQSRFLSTMPRQALAGALRAADLPETTTVNVETARELAFRKSVRAVVVGRVTSAGNGYGLSLRVVDADNGGEIASADGMAAPDSVVPVVQRLGRRLREQLGERRNDIETNQYLLDIATPSLPAFRRYVDALARKQSGDVNGSVSALRAAVSLDSGFGAAWALMALNYIEARNLDSARVALGEALRRPKRLSVAQRYRLLADSAYVLARDLPSAVRWYDEYLKQVPRSIGGRNNRGLYLAMLGRYEDALADFDSAAANNPFGTEQSQPMIINATDMLVALGRLDRATGRARDLTDPYASYAAMRLATVSNRWAAADTIAARVLATRGIAPGLRVEATTMSAASRAARGAVADADRILAAAAARSTGAEQRWYEHARTLLSITSERPPPRLPPPIADDSTPGALVARGMRLALTGDTAAARSIVGRLDALPSIERARLGNGARVVEALVDGRGGRWAHVVETLGPLARAGEHDATNLDRSPSLTMRWLVADAYAHLGRLDSAAVVLERATDYRRVPPGHLALRGFAYPFALRRLALWQAQRGDQSASRRAWAAFRAVFTAPDLPFRRWLGDVPRGIADGA